MAAKFWTISFNGNLYLSSTGAIPSGSIKGCKLTASGVHTLQTNHTKTKTVDFRGNVKFYKNQVDLKNRDIELSILSLPTSVGEDLLALRLDQDANDTTVTMQGSHDEFASFDLEIELVDIVYVEGRFDKWNDVVIRVTSYGENV